MKKLYILPIACLLFFHATQAQVNYGSCQNPTTGSPCFFGLYGFWVASVSFGTLNYTGGQCSGDGTDNGHQDLYNSGSGTVTAGSPYTLTITIGQPSFAESYVMAWVDWNNDGDFTDADELIMTPQYLAAFGGTNAVANVTVPAGATSGDHRLRVRTDGSNPGATPNPCATTGAYGDTKDFKIIVGGGSSCANVGGTAAANPLELCSSGTSTIELSGSAGTIQWQESTDGNNWSNVTGGTGANTTTYTTATLTASTYFRAALSEASCPDVYSTSVQVTVNQPVTPTITISATPSATICQDESISFSAVVTDEGTSPVYVWKVNGNTEGNAATFTPSSIDSGDVVTAELTSNAPCAVNPALSNDQKIAVHSLPEVDLTLPTTIVCKDAPALVLEGGTPLGGNYNGTGVSDGAFDATQAVGSYTITYTYFDGYCTAMDSDVIEISICSGLEEVVAEGYVIAPNPNSGVFQIHASQTFSGIRISHMNGQMIKEISASQATELSIDLGEIASGIYLATMESNGEKRFGKIVVR